MPVHTKKLIFIDDKREKFYELINNPSEQGRNIYLQYRENIIYGVSDNNISESWYMSDCLSPTTFGWVIIDN